MNTHYSNFASNKTNLMWVVLIAGIVFFVYLYRVSISALFLNWNTYGTYSHGYLTIIISIYLVYVSVKEKRLKISHSSFISAVWLLLVSLAWLLAYIANINTMQMLCIPFFLFFTFTYFFGWKNYKTLLIPIYILLFTIPIWSLLLPYLQGIAVNATSIALSFTNLDYQIVDNSVIFSKGIFVIEESCSGLRYVLVGMLLSMVFGFLNYHEYWRTLLLILVSIIIMLIGNLVRILIIIGLGVYKGVDYPLVQDHENLGWVVFAFFLVPLFLFARALNVNVGNANTLVQKSETGKSDLSHSPAIILLLYILVISAAPLFANYIESNQAEISMLDTSKIRASGEWVGPKLHAPLWEPNYLLYSEQFVAQFEKQNNTVALNILHYSILNPEGELINTENKIVDNRDWKIIDSLTGQVVKGQEGVKLLEVNTATITAKKSGECIRIWYWFEVGGENYVRKWRVKLNELIAKLQGRSGSALNAISTRCLRSTMDSDKILNDYLQLHYHSIKESLAF